jgi:hypothetical protein
VPADVAMAVVAGVAMAVVWRAAAMVAVDSMEADAEAVSLGVAAAAAAVAAAAATGSARYGHLYTSG